METRILTFLFAAALLLSSCRAQTRNEDASRQGLDFEAVAASVGNKAGALFASLDRSTGGASHTRPNENILRFYTDPAITRRVNEQIAHTVAPSLAPGRRPQELLRVLNQGDLQKTFAHILEKYRFSTNDLADVLMANLVLCWQVANDAPDLDEAAGYVSIRDALNARLISAEWVRQLDDGQKQTLAETLATSTMLILSRYQHGKQTRDGSIVQLAARDARDMVSEYAGYDLLDYDLTARGFVSRSAASIEQRNQKPAADRIDASSRPVAQAAIRPVGRSAPPVERIALLVDYESGYGGAVYPVYNPYVFFGDGTVVKEPKVAIDELDHQARSKDDGRWGNWKSAGGKVNITWDGLNRRGQVQTSEKDWPGHEAYPATRGETLDGSWSSIGGGGNVALGGTTGIIHSNRFAFSPDGTFTTGSVAGASSHMEIAGTTTGMATHSKRSDVGAYALDGNTITLRFNSGETKRLFFCYLGKDKRVLRIGGSNYTPNKK